MTPGECPHEVDTILIGRQVKSLCTLRGSAIWTNCRHHGYCTLERLKRLPKVSGNGPSDGESEQMELF